MSPTFSRLGGRLAAAGHAGRWEVVRRSGHGLHPFHPHAPPEQLVEGMVRISHRAATLMCDWALIGNLRTDGREELNHECTSP